MVNQRLTDGQAIEERFVIVVIPSDGQDIDHLNENIKKYGLKIDPVRKITGEKTLLDHLDEIKPVLYLSTNPQKVKEAITAAHFGGKSVFYNNERDKEDIPLEQGPLIKFFQALVHLQKKFSQQNCPIRTYLVTSRGTTSPGLRALKTLKENNLEINEAFFLSGAHKGPVLKAIKPHIFFDDQIPHIDRALQNRVIGAHVPYGVSNE